MTQPASYEHEWNQSYERGENYLFFPNEEIIRFVSVYIRKRIGIDRYRDHAPSTEPLRVLDLGCGIGRHLIFGHELGFEMYGIDLSARAVDFARDWLQRAGVAETAHRVKCGSATALPWGDRFFDHVLSHGVLDSMPYSIAQHTVAELTRVLKPGGLFYCDLISGDESGRDQQFSGEVVVEKQHEQGTVQCYFNHEKIRQLLTPRFEVLQCSLVQRHDALNSKHRGRWHVVTRLAS